MVDSDGEVDYDLIRKDTLVMNLLEQAKTVKIAAYKTSFGTLNDLPEGSLDAAVAVLAGELRYGQFEKTYKKALGKTGRTPVYVDIVRILMIGFQEGKLRIETLT